MCAMILLALTVAQSDVLDGVPQTSQRILFAEYILLLTALTGLITLYDMAVCSFPRLHISLDQINRVSVRYQVPRIKLARALDIVAFTIALSIFAVINLYAMNVAFKY